MFDFGALKKSIDTIASEAKTLSEELEQAKREREDIAAAPMPRQELADMLCRYIDTQGGTFPETMSAAAGRVRKFGALPEFDESSERPPLLTWSRVGNTETDRVQAEALCYLLGDVLKDGIRRAVEAMPYPTAEGLPRAERVRQLKALDKKIAKLEADLVAIHRSADAAGVRVHLDPLPGKLKA